MISKPKPGYYYQPARDDISDRIRTVFPSGQVEVFYLWPSWENLENETNVACFAINSKNLKETWKRLKAYDKKAGFPEMEFMGDL